MVYANQKLSTATCRICSNKKNNSNYTFREMMSGSREEFEYFQCGACECIQILEIPPDIYKYYNNSYYSFTNASLDNGLKGFLVRARARAAISGKCWLGRVLLALFPAPNFEALRYLKLPKTARILDVGCGAGRMLITLSDLGYKNLSGIDPYIRENLIYKNGIDIRKTTIKNVCGKWDLVMLHHSFEHVENPLEVMKCIYDALEPGGRCLIRIPTASSYAWNHYRENWVQLDAPRHFFLHSVRSIQILSELSGLILEKIIYDSNAFQILGSEQYKLDIDMKSPLAYHNVIKRSVFSIRQVLAASSKSRMLNASEQGDQAAFFFVKPL